MSDHRNKGSFITVYEWMISELGLGGNELIIYACIYGFNKATGNNFFGSVKYLSRWTSADHSAISDALKKLTEKGYVKRNSTQTVEGKNFYTYFARAAEKDHGGSQKENYVHGLKGNFVEIDDDEIDDLFPS